MRIICYFLSLAPGVLSWWKEGLAIYSDFYFIRTKVLALINLYQIEEK